MNAKLDQILETRGIDRGAAFGGYIKGDGHRLLMENADSIITEFIDVVIRTNRGLRLLIMCSLTNGLGYNKTFEGA